MPYVASITAVNQLVASSQLVGNGQCVALVHAAIVSPPSSAWHRGEQVIGNAPIRPGTVIATFDANGRYGNHVDGTSHAAICLRQTSAGMVVIDWERGP